MRKDRVLRGGKLQLSSLQVDIIASLEQVSSEIQKWKDSYLLVSPIQGIVTFTNIWGAYQNVEAGIIVFNIIPTPQKELIGKLTMNMMRSGKVKKNQSVNIYFDNYPEREFGMVKGVVKSISLVPNKDNNYIVEVSFPYGLKTTYGKMLPEQQEMRATAKIVTENTNLLEQLLLPFKMIFKNQQLSISMDCSYTNEN